jgi:cytochrome P450
MVDAEIPEPTRMDGHNRGAIAEAGGLYGFLLGLHEAHGGIARFWLNPETPIVSIADPALVAETLRIGDRPVSLFRFLEPLLGARNIQVLSAPEAREHRKLMIPTLGHERVLRYSFERLVLKTAGLRERWAAAADAGDVVPLQKDLTELSFDMIGTVAFGSAFESEALGARMTSSFNDVLHEFLH